MAPRTLGVTVRTIVAILALALSVAARAQPAPYGMMQAAPAATVVISSINLSSTSFSAATGNANSTIGTISAACTPSPCTGSTFALATQSGCNSTNNGSFVVSAANLNIGGSDITTAGTYNICLKASASGAADKYQSFALTGSTSTACVNSGSNLCFLLGSFGPDSGSTTWMNRPWDFTDNFIGQNQCQQFINNGFGGYPFEGGMDNPSPGPGYGDYTTEVPANAACPNQVYGYKTQNEWWLNCNQTNPWYGTSGCPPGPQNESLTPTTSIAQFRSNVCTAINAARAQYPGIKVSWYAPGNSTEAQFDPSLSGACTVDAYEIHIYIYGAGQAGRTAQGDWAGGTPYSCSPPAGVHGALPGDVICSTSTPVGFAINYAKQQGKPIALTEVCEAYNDTTGPNGTSYATWAISELAKANNTSVVQWWSGTADGNAVLPGGTNDCTISGYSNKQNTMNFEFGGTHYAGTFYTFKPIPSPNPRP